MQENDKILYNVNKQPLKIVDLVENTIRLEQTRIITISYNNGKNTEQKRKSIQQKKHISFIYDESCHSGQKAVLFLLAHQNPPYQPKMLIYSKSDKY
jgi:hypothetical protein